MNRQLLAAAVVAAFSCGAASAQDFKGDITLGYSAFLDDTDFNTLSGTGAFEFGMGDRASAQLDLGIYGYGFVGLEATNVVLHGIYDVMPQSSVGLFLGLERAAGSTTDFYGLEYGQSFGAGGFEVYAGRGEEAGVRGTVMGVEGSFAVNDAVGIGLKLDNADFNGVADVTRLGVKGTYAVGRGTSLYGEVGTVRADVLGLSNSEPFLGVGMSFNLGNDEATFGRRGLLNLLPGS